MVLLNYTNGGAKRVNDLSDLFRGQTAILAGGSPSLKDQEVGLLEQRGVLSMAINNAGKHFRSSLWVSGDDPHCYEPRLLLDPTIMKFAPADHANIRVLGRPYYMLPNIFFYIIEANIPWGDYLAQRGTVPWYNNTLFSGIHILYQLGVRRIILAGSDFGLSAKGDMYAHPTTLSTLEQKWNMDLYNNLVQELRMLKPIFDKFGLELLDCSKHSRISQVYKHITIPEAVKLCLESFPSEEHDPRLLPHCSKFASKTIQEQIARWPGYNLVEAMDAGKAETVTLI